MGSESDLSCLFCAGKVLPSPPVDGTKATLIVNEDGETVEVKREVGDGVVEEDAFVGSRSRFSLSEEKGPGEEDVPIQDDLRLIFIVRKVLDFPEEKCEQYLRRLKEDDLNPALALAMCDKCNGTVKECYQTYQQIKNLEGKLLQVKVDLKTLIRESSGQKRNLKRRKRLSKLSLSDDIRKCALELLGSMTEDGHAAVSQILGDIDTSPARNLRKRKTTVDSYKCDGFGERDPLSFDWDEDGEGSDVDWNSKGKQGHSSGGKAEAIAADISSKAGHGVKTSSTESAVENKVKTNLATYTFKCDKCPAVFRNHSGIKEHARLHFNSSGIRCPICDWLCPEGKLFNHMSKWHPDRKCKLLNPPSSTPKVVQRDRHRINVPLFSCGKCGSEFVSKQLLQRHSENVHSDIQTGDNNNGSPLIVGPLEHPCSECSESFDSKLKLDRHNAKIHRASLFKCEDCGFQAKKLFFLKMHMRKHQKSEPVDSDSAITGTVKKRGRSKNSNVPAVPTSIYDSPAQEIRTIVEESSKPDNTAEVDIPAPPDLDDEFMQWAVSPVSVDDNENDDDTDWNPPDKIDEEEDPPVKKVRPRGRPSKKSNESEDVPSLEDFIGNTEKILADPNNPISGELNGIEMMKEQDKPNPTTSTAAKDIDISSEQAGKVEDGKKVRIVYHHKCSSCPAVYSTLYMLKIHDALHKRNSGVNCPECGWHCEESRLSHHMQSRHSRSWKKKSKPKSRSPKIMKYKYKRVVNKGLPYYCDHCHMIFTSAAALKRHCLTNHPNEPSSSCEKCSLDFSSKQLLQLHTEEFHEEAKMTDVKINHVAEDEKHDCAHCSESFTSKINLDFHIAKIHPASLLKCRMCNYQADKYSKLNIHIRTKHEMRKVICELCSKELKTHSLNSHMRIYHFKEIGGEPKTCTYADCQRIYIDQRALQRHILHFHKKVKECCCEYCGKAFARQSDLRKHALLHTVPRDLQYKKGPFICKYCPDGTAIFNVRQGLYYHMKNKHSDKYFIRCKKCGKGYAQQSMLREHEKVCISKSGKTVESSAAEVPI